MNNNKQYNTDIKASIKQDPVKYAKTLGIYVGKDASYIIKENTANIFYMVVPALSHLQEIDFANVQAAGVEVGTTGTVSSVGTAASAGSACTTFSSASSAGSIGSAGTLKV